jgi:hypothetical protein
MEFRHVLIGHDDGILHGKIYQIGNLTHNNIVLAHRREMMPAQNDLCLLRVLFRSFAIHVKFKTEGVIVVFAFFEQGCPVFRACPQSVMGVPLNPHSSLSSRVSNSAMSKITLPLLSINRRFSSRSNVPPPRAMTDSPLPVGEGLGVRAIFRNAAVSKSRNDRFALSSMI